jgi:hypothetical protein
MEKEQVLGRVASGATMEVRVTSSEDKGKRFVDIRLFYMDVNALELVPPVELANRPPEVFKPTKKGCFLKEEVFKELMETVLIPKYDSMK